jgi:hypothetical protein
LSKPRRTVSTGRAFQWKPGDFASNTPLTRPAWLDALTLEYGEL